MFKNMKDNVKLIALDKAIKSIDLFKDGDKILFAYESIFKIINPLMKINFDNVETMTKKQLRKISSQVKMIKRVSKACEKHTNLFSKNKVVLDMHNEFKTLSKKYISLS